MIPGLSTLGESLQSLISKNFLISGFLPTVLFVIASFWPVSVIWPDTWAAIAAQLEDLGTLSNLFSFQLLALIVASYVIWSFRASFRELLEGRFLWRSARDRLTAYQSDYRGKLENKRDALKRDRVELRKAASMDVFEARNVDDEADDETTVARSKEQWANTLHNALVKVRSQEDIEPAGKEDLDSLANAMSELKTLRSRRKDIDFKKLKACHDDIIKHCSPEDYAALSPTGDKRLADAVAELPDLARYALARTESEYARLLSLVAYRFPNDRRDIGPTALANMSEIQRSYAKVRYGINIDIIRPRLQKLIDEDASFGDLMDATQSHVDANVVMTILSLAYGLAWFLPMAVESDSPMSFIVLVAASALSTMLFYSLAVRAARRNGEVLSSAVDLFRFDLLDLLHIGKPADSEEETALWKRVMGHFAIGSGEKIEYDHGDDAGLDELAADGSMPLDDDGESQIETVLSDIRDRIRDIFR